MRTTRLWANDGERDGTRVLQAACQSWADITFLADYGGAQAVRTQLGRS